MENSSYIFTFLGESVEFEITPNFQELVGTIAIISNLDIEELISVTDEDLNAKLTDIDRFIIRQRKPAWISSLIWVIKHQTKAFQNNQFPFTNPNVKKFESFGNYLNSLLELCYRSIDLANDVKFQRNNSKTAIFWWIDICSEMMLGSMGRKNEFTIGLFHTASTKEQVSKNIQKEIKMLTSRQNPYPQMKNLGGLIDICLNISEVNPKDSNVIKSKKSDFRSGAWKNFINAYSHLDVKSLVSNIQVIDGSKVYTKEGGRQKKLIYPPQEGFLRQTRQGKKS